MIRLLTCTVIGCLIFVCGTSQCAAFPGPPLSLYYRWEEADLVALVKVTQTGKLRAKNHPPGQRVTLDVKQILKGSADESKNKVKAFTTFGSPVPFHFEKGQTLLVFLRMDEDLPMLTPISYESCIPVDDDTFEHYADALKQLPEILELNDSEIRRARLVDWSVSCAANPVTRYDGVIGLWYLRGKDKGKPTDPLTELHRKRLVEAITAETPPHPAASSVAEFLEPYPSPELDRYLLESLRLSHEPGWRDLTRTAVEQLPDRLGIKLNASTEARLDQWGDLLSEVYYDFDNKNTPEQTAEAEERYHILWGSLSREIYNQCKQAIDAKERVQPVEQLTPDVLELLPKIE